MEIPIPTGMIPDPGSAADTRIPGRNCLRIKPAGRCSTGGENGLTIPINPVSFPENTDILILMLGTNDLLQMRSPEETAERMEVFLGKINLDPERILLLAPPPMEFGEWVPDPKLIHNLTALKTLYRDLAERMCLRFVSPEQHQIMAYDGIHMTQAGHRELAEQLYTYFQEEIEICWKKE